MRAAERKYPSEGDGAWQVLRGTTLLAISRILDRASTFVIVVMIAPRFGAAGVGTYSAAIALYQLFTFAGAAGTGSYLVRAISRDKTRTASYVVHLSIMAFVVSLLLVAAMEAIVPHVGYSSALQTSAAIALLAVPGTVLNSVQEAAFLAHRRVEFETLMTLLGSLAYIGVGAALLVSHHGVTSLLWAYVAIEYLTTAAYFGMISRYIARLQATFHVPLAWRLAREMKTFTASSVVQAFFLRPEIVILSLLASPAQVGYYSSAIRVAEIPEFLPEAFMANVFPMMSAAFGVNEQRFTAIQTKAARAILAFALPAATLMFVLAPQIVRLLFGPHFGPAADALRVLCLTVLSLSLIALFWRTLSARGRQDQVLHVQLAVIGIKIGACAALAVPLAALGAAISATVSSWIQMGMLAVRAGASGTKISILRPGLRFAVAALLAGAVGWLLASLTSIWIALPAAALTYIASALLVRAVSADDRALLARLHASARARAS